LLPPLSRSLFEEAFSMGKAWSPNRKKNNTAMKCLVGWKNKNTKQVYSGVE
jgi:hypothetical protein